MIQVVCLVPFGPRMPKEGAELGSKARIVEDDFALSIGPEAFAYILEFEHLLSPFLWCKKFTQ